MDQLIIDLEKQTKQLDPVLKKINELLQSLDKKLTDIKFEVRLDPELSE